MGCTINRHMHHILCDYCFKICKLVYMNMLTPIVQQPDKVFNKWKNYFNNDLSIDDWLNSFEIIYNCTKFIDLQGQIQDFFPGGVRLDTVP